MKLLRAFLAVEIPFEIRQQLAQLIAPLNRAHGNAVRWVRSENIHLTMKFLGDCEPARLEKINRALRPELEGLPSFDLNVGGFGVFPAINHPRVFWCGLSCTPALINLYEKVELVCASSGFQREHRPFSPHLTLGRGNERAAPHELREIAAAIQKISGQPIGVVRVDGLTAFQSQLSPGGSIYTPLHKIPLGRALD
jgi:2'-5' RNA ligase